MKMSAFMFPDQFKAELKRRSQIDGVTMTLYLQNLMREKWDWPVEVLPDGNSYRPAAGAEPILHHHAARFGARDETPRTVGYFANKENLEDSEDF